MVILNTEDDTYVRSDLLKLLASPYAHMFLDWILLVHHIEKSLLLLLLLGLVFLSLVFCKLPVDPDQASMLGFSLYLYSGYHYKFSLLRTWYREVKVYILP